MPPKPDLSFSGLEEFPSEPIFIKPIVENSKAKASEAKPKAVRKNNDIDTELVEGSEVRAKGSEQKVDEDKEIPELQRLIEVVPDKEKVAIDAIHLATKPPSI
ncbi:hypothetical protein Tco_1322707, partial [Tanacetum coccineum]